MTEDESQAAAEDLAKRLRLLMDVAVAETGSELTYSQIADYLKERKSTRPGRAGRTWSTVTAMSGPRC